MKPPIFLSLLLLLGAGLPSPAADPPKLAAQIQTVLGVDDNPFKGDKNAKLTIIEFSDYQCPVCAGHFRETLPQIEKDYIKTGKVKYIFRDFPIETIHPQAPKAHEAAHCAAEQGKYWEMHDRLFANPKALTRTDLSRHAQAIALDMARFQSCLDRSAQADKVRADLQAGIAFGVKSTPTFLLLLAEPNKQEIKTIKRLRGAAPYEAFKKALDGLLASLAM